MSNSETLYTIALTETEIRALYDAITAADRTTGDLAGAADKLAWSVDFLNAPDFFADELDSMRVKSV
jgi:hypothetical protein